MKRQYFRTRFAPALLLTLFCPVVADQLDDARKQGAEILKIVRKDVEKNYFDPNFGGADMQAAFARAEENMKNAQSVGHTFGIIAQALTTLNDSHTFFIPPSRAGKVNYGWRFAMVGDRCFVTGVKPGSDAEAKDMKTGDEILAIEGFPPSRGTLWKMRYTTPSSRERRCGWPCVDPEGHRGRLK